MLLVGGKVGCMLVEVGGRFTGFDIDFFYRSPPCPSLVSSLVKEDLFQHVKYREGGCNR